MPRIPEDTANLELSVIGNGSFAAWIDSHARTVFGCLPRFDADATFCSPLSPVGKGSERWSHYPQTCSLVGLIQAAMRTSRRWQDAL